MTTVAEAKRELAQIAERQAELQKIVDAAPKSLLPAPTGHVAWLQIGPIAMTRSEGYADALDTLLVLRQQPGTEAAHANGDQWAIETFAGKVSIDCWCSDDCKLRAISPMFATESDAQAAIDTIGADRILRMFRTLHGVAA